MKTKVTKGIVNILVFIGIIAVMVFVLLPIVWAGLTALKDPIDVNAFPPKVFFKPSLINWKIVNQDWEFLKFLKSSLIVSVSATLIAVAVGTLAAYSFSRYRIKGKQSIALDILTIRMIPPIVAAVPIFIISRQLGIYNTYGLLIILYATFNFPLVVWLMKAFIDDIPTAFEESALVDGCNRFQAFIRIILPLSIPGLAANIILTFIFCWNEFLFASIMVAGPRRTLPTVVALAIKQRSVLWGSASMAAILVIIPVIILTLTIQRHIVSGLTFGALKE